MTLIKTNYNRRSFLKVSTAAGGGLILGFNWLAACTPKVGETVRQAPEEWFNINAFLKIGNNGVVTIMSPNPEVGQNVKTTMPMIVAEELDVDWHDVIVEQAGLDTDKYTRQVAGGSQSIRQGWQSLRLAGATARRMLMEAAAQQWQVPVSELTTGNGLIKHGAGKSLGYGEVASAAAALPVPADVELKDHGDFKLIGKPTKNVDGPQIVTGRQVYGLDFSRPGMLVAMIEHPPAFGMQLKSVEDTQARAMPGIKEVFTIKDSTEETTPEMVVVVGNSTWEVMKAKKALHIEWEQVTPAESTKDHVQKLTGLMEVKPEKAARQDGDPERAFAGAANVIEREYTAPFLPHNPLEPMNFFAEVTADKAELIGPIQTPESLRKMAARALGMDPGKVSVMMTGIGGGFGRRLYGHFGVEAALISQKIKAPVKVVYTREDDMTRGIYRPAYKVRYRAALDAANNLIGFHVRGAGYDRGPVFANRYPAGAVANYLAENHNVKTNITTGAWRAPRSNFIAGAENSFLDEIAEVAGKDPVAFRLELFDRAIDNPVGEDNDYDAKRYAGVIRLVKEKANWGKEEPGVYRGFSAYYCHNSYVAQVLDLVMKDGVPRVKKVWSAVDCGIVVNPEGARNQIEGGIVDGLGNAFFGGLTFTAGKPDKNNFDNYQMIRQREAPLAMETFFVENGIDPTGLGEPGLPPIFGALANALYKATGQRYYHQPFMLANSELGLRQMES